MFKRQLPQYVQLGNVLCSFGFSQGWNKIPCVRWDFIMEAAYIAVLLHNFFLLKHSTYLSCSNTNRLAYRQWIISAPGSAQTFFFWLLDFFFSLLEQQSNPTCCLLHTREGCVAETQHLLTTSAVLGGPNAVVKFQYFVAYGVTQVCFAYPPNIIK